MDEELTTLQQVIEYQCSCEKVISSLQTIHDNPGCPGDIEDIEDIIGIFNYYQPQGKHICELDKASKLFRNDLFLVSQLSSASSHLYQSRKCNYSQLKSQLLEDLMNAFNLGSMAYENKFRYSLTSHNHDATYNLVSYSPNEKYQDPNYKTPISCLGKIFLSTEMLTTTDVINNPSQSNLKIEEFDVNCPQYSIPLPPRPLVGTLRFISSKSIKDLIDKNLIQYDNEYRLNVNPYDPNNKIRDDFDGWVFPNGKTFYNYDNQLSDAAFVFSEDHDSSKTSFVVPTLTSFFQACGNADDQYSIDLIPAQLGLAPHQHAIEPIQFSCNLQPDLTKTQIQTTNNCGGNQYIHRGYDDGNHKVFPFTSKLTLAGAALTDLTTSESGDSNEKQYQPKHNLIPVMIYIGGVTRRYYENIS